MLKWDKDEGRARLGEINLYELREEGLEQTIQICGVTSGFIFVIMRLIVGDCVGMSPPTVTELFSSDFSAVFTFCLGYRTNRLLLFLIVELQEMTINMILIYWIILRCNCGIVLQLDVFRLVGSTDI